jgi:2-phospho-L-lactate guanylyltransferase
VTEVWAALPVKEFAGAKQRLSPLLGPEQRQVLAATMVEDVLAALAGAQLAGIMVNTLDPTATVLAQRYGARVVREGARDGHTGAVVAMGRILAAEGRAMLTMPGDIPRVTAVEVDAVLAAMAPPPSFTIVPAHDELGSNAVLCAPPNVVPLRFGDNSYFPHLAAARQCGVEPTVIRAPGIALDIDNPQDLVAFLRAEPPMETRTRKLLESWGLAGFPAVHPGHLERPRPS